VFIFYFEYLKTCNT